MRKVGYKMGQKFWGLNLLFSFHTGKHHSATALFRDDSAVVGGGREGAAPRDVVRVAAAAADGGLLRVQGMSLK